MPTTDADIVKAARAKWPSEIEKFGVSDEPDGSVSLVKTFGILGYETLATAPTLDELLAKVQER